MKYRYHWSFKLLALVLAVISNVKKLLRFPPLSS